MIEQGLLSQEKINELELRQKIEKHLVEIKGHGSSFAALPRPVKLIASNVKNITLKSSVLVIETDVDKYFFKFPRKYNTQIRSALFMAQFKV